MREIQRIYLVSMSAVYQEMVEAIVGKVTINAYGATGRVLCRSIDGLDRLQRASFAKVSVNFWVGLRMTLLGYTLQVFNALYPVMQYVGLLNPQSAALVRI